ncbi:MAG: hypothetical protein KKH44_06960, partial [Bacteroidetes bacterium]|nr:hypothetical protein [Bacteroidota bacterium]
IIVAKNKIKQSISTDNDFNISLVKQIVKNVYLGGIIDEAILWVKKDEAYLSILDKTGCVFAFSKKECMSNKEMFLPIKELGFFSKALAISDNDEDIDFEVEDNRWLKLNVKNHGKVKMLLAESEDMIPNAIEDYRNPISKMEETIAVKFEISKDSVDKFLYFQNFVKNTTTMINIDKGKVTIGSGAFETRTFSVDFGTVENIDNNLSVSVLGSHLCAIFELLDYSDANKPIICLGFIDGAPIIIKNGDNTFWALTPSVSVGEE